MGVPPCVELAYPAGNVDLSRQLTTLGFSALQTLPFTRSVETLPVLREGKAVTRQDAPSSRQPSSPAWFALVSFLLDHLCPSLSLWQWPGLQITHS